MPQFINTKLRLSKGYQFKVMFDAEDVPELAVDEIKPVGESVGPNPTRLLSTAVGHCLSSSLLFCLRKSKVEIKDLETTVKASVERTAQGHLRVKTLDVQICFNSNENDKSKVDRCSGIFEKYSAMAQSVRKGIDIKVAVN